MDKGIRVNVNNKFKELLPERNASTDKARDKKFRRDVMHYAIEEFNCTVAAAATHYNHALKLAQKEIPEQVAGLGRPEDKKGGRKKKVVAETAAEGNQEAAKPAATEGESEEAFAFSTVEPATFVVKKKKDNSIVAEGLSLTDAEAMVEKNKGVRFAPALYWE